MPDTKTMIKELLDEIGVRIDKLARKINRDVFPRGSYSLGPAELEERTKVSLREAFMDNMFLFPND